MCRTTAGRSLILAALATAAGLGLVPHAARADIAEAGSLRVRLTGRIFPHALPRITPAPVRVFLSSTISTADGSLPPQLRSLQIAINREGRTFDRGIPNCNRRLIQHSQLRKALAACAGSLIGHGRVEVLVATQGQPPYRVRGRLLAFKARVNGRDGILTEVFAKIPPASLLMPLAVRRLRGSVFGTTLAVRLPRVAFGWAYLTRFDLTLGRTYRFRGTRHSYISAACPAPPLFPGAVFPLALATYRFAGGITLTSHLNENCRAIDSVPDQGGAGAAT